MKKRVFEYNPYPINITTIVSIWVKYNGEYIHLTSPHFVNGKMDGKRYFELMSM